MGAISDKFGRKPVLLFGLTATSILVLVMSFFTDFISLAIIISVIGFTSGAIWIVGPIISAEAVEPVKRGAAIGAYRTFFDLGSFVGPILMTAIMTKYNVKTTFYIASGFLFIVIPLVTRLHETKRQIEKAVK